MCNHQPAFINENVKERPFRTRSPSEEYSRPLKLEVPQPAYKRGAVEWLAPSGIYVSDCDGSWRRTVAPRRVNGSIGRRSTLDDHDRLDMPVGLNPDFNEVARFDLAVHLRVPADVEPPFCT